MKELRNRLHLLYIGGMGPRNMHRCYHQIDGSASPTDKGEKVFSRRISN